MNISYDAKSFLIDGRRIWLVAGEIHYFRHPRGEWREVLLRAKRAGLNTISTYVPWNFHEETEGAADFAGDKDLAAYIDLIGELGMYAMLRPGPYICSEWDGGGLPAWLCAKPLRRFREDDPVYMAAVTSWFDRLLPIISARQITKGGPVITVQNENEYPGGWDPSMRRYIGNITAIFRRHGIEVPLMACNVHGASETACKINDATEEQDQILDPELILTYNHHYIIDPICDLKNQRPDHPLVVTEFWCGAPIYWGNRITDWPEYRLLARAAYEYASVGAQVDYYMFEGGTNFGFWGGNNIATTYASGYPVGEGGKLTPKYYAVRPANLFAASFAECLADSEEAADKGGIVCPAGVRLIVRRSGAGSFAFVSAHDSRKDIPLTLAGGTALTVHLGEVSAAVLPLDLELFGGRAKVDYSNLCLLAQDEGRKLLILYGQAGTEGVVSLNGTELRIPVGRRQVVRREAGDVTVLVADEEMARRCWTVDGEIVFGPDYAAERNADGSLDVKINDGTPEIVYVDAAGRLAGAACKREAISLPLPELRSWQTTPCAEVAADDSQGWQILDRPCSHERLGVHGYVWYSADLECEADGVEKLLLTNTCNRVSVFVNGEFCGTHAERRTFLMRDEYGHPADWLSDELTVQVKQGKNRFVFLSDDMGHNYDVPIATGIQGPVFLGSRRLEASAFREVAPQPVSDDAFYFLYNRIYRERAPLPALEFELDAEPGRETFISIHGVHAWITVDGEDVLPMSFPESPWTMFAGIKRWIGWRLPERPDGGKLTVRVHYEGCLPDAVKENMMIYTAPQSGELANWRWKAWTDQPDSSAEAVSSRTDAGADKDGIVVLLPVGGRIKRKGRRLTPAYLETRFPTPDGERPVYLNIGELQKGQIFLNGHNLGRFWAIGETQHAYYLPRSWMREENRLVVFEELGLNPQGVALEFGGEDWSGVPLELS